MYKHWCRTNMGHHENDDTSLQGTTVTNNIKDTYNY